MWRRYWPRQTQFLFLLDGDGVRRRTDINTQLFLALFREYNKPNLIVSAISAKLAIECIITIWTFQAR